MRLFVIWKTNLVKICSTEAKIDILIHNLLYLKLSIVILVIRTNISSSKNFNCKRISYYMTYVNSMTIIHTNMRYQYKSNDIASNSDKPGKIAINNAKSKTRKNLKEI